MAVAANLSPEHHFLGIMHHTLDANGNRAYVPYNSYPLGGHLLIRLATMPFGDDFSAQLLAARTLMLLCFAANAVLAYLSLCRLTGRRWIALTATLLTFSSSYWLHYNDMVSTEIGLDLFGLMLCFHGMTIFAQDGRFRQLLAKACIALLLGWHVLALLLPFAALGLIRGLLRRMRMARGSSPGAWLRPAIVALPRSRHLALGVFALLFGLAMLSLNIAREYLALQGETTLMELPTVQSVLGRTVLVDAERQGLDRSWKHFWECQFPRIGLMSLPYALSGGHETFSIGWAQECAGGGVRAIGILVSCVGLIGLAFVRHRTLMATLALSGFCWTLPVRGSFIPHDFETLSHTGLVLVFFTLVALGLHRLFGQRLSVGMAVAALLILAYSSARMAHLSRDHEAIPLQEALTADFQEIRRMAEGRSVFVPRALLTNHPLHMQRKTFAPYYLAGSPIVFAQGQRDFADLVVVRECLPGAALLTPSNRLVFLYDRAAYDAMLEESTPLAHQVRANETSENIWQAGLPWPCLHRDAPLGLEAALRAARSADPDLRAEFDLHLTNGQLIYFKEPCDQADADAGTFFLHVFPKDEADLPGHRKRLGFDNLDFPFFRRGARIQGVCVAAASLPEYPIASIHTGQYDEQGQLWNARLLVAK